MQYLTALKLSLILNVIKTDAKVVIIILFLLSLVKWFIMDSIFKAVSALGCDQYNRLHNNNTSFANDKVHVYSSATA